MQELKFRDWKQRFAPNDSGEDYDLRGAFKAGFQPDPETGHWPDVYKKPNHPTFSNQSIYAKDRPDLAGSWNGDTYVPAQQTQQRIADAFAASEGMQEPSQALYEAKHRRAQQGQPVEPGFWSDVASLGPSIRGGLKAIADPRTSPLGPAAIARMFLDPAGEVGRQVETGEQLAKPFTQFNDPNVDPVKQAADLALTAMGGSSVVPEEANALRMGIKAYHGSPHDFERFDSSKIGTGEGAQAYGHGLYFGENPEIANQYARTVTAKQSGWARTTPPAFSSLPENELAKIPEEMRGRIAASWQNNGEEVAKNLTRQLFEKSRGTEYSDALHSLANTEWKTPGHRYEVDIAADPEHFLDWDKPLSEQSPKVREALLQTGDPDKVKALEADYRRIYDEYMGRPENTSAGDLNRMERRVEQAYNAWRDEIGNAHKSGAAVYGELATQKRDYGIDSGKTALTTLRGSQAGAAEDLKAYGIPGIRYLDQGSRVSDAAQKIIENYGSREKALEIAEQRLKSASLGDIRHWQGIVDELKKSNTSNYVVFPGNEHLIAILKKYGLPISAAGLAALSQLHPQEAQAAQRRTPAASK
jgi:hypothetical protein